jgi:hypothetical protein
MMALASGVLGTYACVLKTRESSCVARPVRTFFIYLRPMIHWEPRDAWQHRDPPWLGGRVRSYKTRDSVGAHLNQEVRFGAIGHVETLEPTSAGRWGPEPLNTWQCRSPLRQGDRVQRHRTCGSARAYLDWEEGSGAVGHETVFRCTHCSLSYLEAYTWDILSVGYLHR